MMEVKGGAIKDTPLFVKEKFGEDGYRRWFSSLPPESIKIFSSKIFTTYWYPYEFASKQPGLKIIELFYNNDPKGGIEIGEWFAEKLLTGIYKAFAKIGSSSMIISRTSTLLSEFYRPTKLEIVDSKKTV